MRSALLSIVLCLALKANALLVINAPTSILCDDPEKGSHIENILRYGTPVEILEEKEDWVKIGHKDGNGWIKREELFDVEDDPNITADAFVGTKGAYFFHVADTEWGPLFQLPFEAPVQILEELPQQHNRWLHVKLQDGKTGYIQRSQLRFSPPTLSFSEMVAFSKQFLGIKYLWGGTTSFGYDCSGYVQMLYRQMGVTIPRNSRSQAEDPQFFDVELEDLREGDLVFFKNVNGRIVHVGMMINQQEFIHACTKQDSWISINSIDDERFTNGYFFYAIKARRLFRN